MLGSLLDHNVEWVINDLQGGGPWTKFGEEVLSERIELGIKGTRSFQKRNSLHAERQQENNTVVGTPVLVKDSPGASRAWELGEDGLLQVPADLGTFVSLSQRYGKAKSLSDGRHLHACISRHGYDRNTFIGNCLVQMYGDCGCLEDAQVVFDQLYYPDLYSWNKLIKAYTQNGNLDEAKSMFWRMPRRDVVSWSIMIKAYTQHEHGNEALELFHQMQLEDVQPDNITFICVLDACTHLAALNEGHEVHCAIVDKGYRQDVVLETALINMYGKCGCLDNAKIIFGAMHRRDVVSWSAMIGACSRNEHGEEALELFHQMNLEGIEPNKVTFICVLDACASLANLRGGQEIHAVIINSGHECDVAVGTALISMYGKCKSFDYALSMFSRMPQQDVVSCSTMITACAQNAHGKEALELFHQMWLQGFEPNIVTFICILDVCALFAAGEDGHHIHAAIVVCGYEQDIAVGNALVSMYSKCGNLDGARKVFHKMPQPDVVSWTAMIMAYAHNGHDKAALELFRLMHLEHVMPDKITFICVLGACTGSTDLDAGREIHAAIIENGYEQEVAVGTALIDMYGRCWSLDDARNVPGRMPQQDVACRSAMITACAQNGHSKEALELFRQMQLEGMKLDKVSFLCVLDACATLAGLEEGQAIHAAIMDNGFEVDAVVGNALVSMYGKCGSLDNARIVFDTLPQRDVVSWSALITACAENGHGKEAMQYFHQMQHEGIEPNKITFMGVLTACNHMGSVENGRHFFNSMKDHKIIPTVEHHLCMIDLLGRAGHLDEAEDLVDSVTCRKVAMAWLSLLAACRIHGDIKRGAHAASYCFELDPMNLTPYVILSNIYAAAGRWEDVANVRVALKNVSVNQQEGHRCLEVNQSVHEFVAQDL